MSDTNEKSGLSQFMAEMRRRHVVRFALGYAAAAFVILQLGEILFPAFGIGEGGLRTIAVLAALGFPPALVLAWVYDLTKEGIKRTQGTTSPILHRLAVGGLLVATVAATGAAGVYLARQGVFESAAAEPDNLASPVTLATYDPSEPIRSMAVLPLDDYSPDQSQAYFTASMHEELIANLSQLEEVRVVSRTSVMQYAGTTMTMPEIGRELGVDVIVYGSASRTPERTRVTLQIVHAPSDSPIETLQWDREQVDDVLAFQTEIAREVVGEIGQDTEVTVVQAASNVAPEAQDAYFRGKYEYERGTPDGYEMAIEYFEDAVDEEPDFAPAMAGLAGARFLRSLEGDMSEVDILQARDEAHTALTMDPTSVEAMDVLGMIERSLPRLMDEPPVLPAPASGARSIQIVTMPGGGDSIEIDVAAFDTAWVSALTTLGARIEEHVRRRTDVSGRESSTRMTFEARQLLSSGRYSEAAGVLEAAVEANPESAGAWDMLARTYMSMGDVDGALETIDSWHDTGMPGAPTEAHVEELEDEIDESGEEGYWSWKLERLEEMERERRVPKMELATTHAALGNDDEAFEYLVEALRAGEPGIMGLRSDPVWDDLRSDPRMREIARRAQQMRASPTRRPPRGRGGA